MKTHHVLGGPPEHRRISRVFLASALHQFRGPEGIVGIKLAWCYEAVRTILLTQGAHRIRVAPPSALPSPRQTCRRGPRPSVVPSHRIAHQEEQLTRRPERTQDVVDPETRAIVKREGTATTLRSGRSLFHSERTGAAPSGQDLLWAWLPSSHVPTGPLGQRFVTAADRAAGSRSHVPCGT